MTEPNSHTPIPALLFTGFLGAGKTTLLNRFLEYYAARTERIAVLVNEFGSEGVDAHLIAPGPHAVYEVNRGSIFCVCVKEDFIGALDAIASAHPPFDIVLVEATGVAQTRNLNAYLQEHPLFGKIRIERNFCLVDALNYHKVHATLPAAREQVEAADVIILNKTNLADGSLVRSQEELARELNPEAILYHWDGGDIDIGGIVSAAGDRSRAVRGGLSLCPPPNFRSITVTLTGIVDPDRLREFIGALPEDAFYRVKGILRLPSGPFLVERTLDGWSIQPVRAFKDGSESFMVFIGRSPDEASLRSGLERCVAS